MKNAVRTIKAMSLVFVLAALAAIGAFSPLPVYAGPNYRSMVEETGTLLNEALTLYKKGDVPEAKQKAQAAYFEIYENLEGPIRINVSARKNAELEEEFIAIRNMIVAGDPAEAMEKKIDGFMAELRKLIPELERGVEMVAEAPDETKQPRGMEGEAGLGNIEPVWLQAFENIQAGLGKALDTFKKGDSKGAAVLVVQTQFDHYKNSLLETAVRRSVSQKKNFENNSGFSEIAGMMQSGKSPNEVEMQTGALIKGLKEDLPGLHLVEVSVSKKEAGKSAEKAAPRKDWTKVTSDLFNQIDKAIALYEKGETRNAVNLLQDAYFDVFEASGMEAKVGARDANFKSRLEGHFSLIVAQMKSGAAANEIKGPLGAMRDDFDKAAAMLGKGRESAATIFFYSLMIILREGIEAILIITAIVAYLLKTGNRDKLRIIYNGCISALVLSVVTALLVKWVFRTSAASQEVLEGAAMLLAAAVLFSVSYWLISKAEAQKWVAYIKDKVATSLSANSLRALWFAAFLAVYREGAETVLFYQALASDLTTSGLSAVAGGFLLGCVLLIAVYLIMRHGAVKLPIRPFFLFTGVLLYCMSFVFVGKGMAELISGKIFEPTLISWLPTIDFIGLYPYAQTLIPQLIIILAAAAGLVVMVRRRSISAKEASNE